VPGPPGVAGWSVEGAKILAECLGAFLGQVDLAVRAADPDLQCLLCVACVQSRQRSAR
jgi:hypothetical protein